MKLFILDIDNTVTKGPSIWEVIHQNLGTWDKGQKYLRQFACGEIDFKQFANYDVNCWQGQSEQRIKQIFAEVRIRKGFYDFLDFLQSRQIKIAVLSSSIKQFVEYLDKNDQFDLIIANPLEISNNVLTGNIGVEICCFDKGYHFEQILQQMGVTADECGGIGDSNYDLPFLSKIRYPFIMGNKLVLDQIENVRDFSALQKRLTKLLK